MKQQGEQPMETFSNIANCLTVEKPTSFEDCVKWARLQWQKDYHNQVVYINFGVASSFFRSFSSFAVALILSLIPFQIVQLLHNFPADQTTSSGALFWSGPKRCPHALQFDVNNEMHFSYVFTGANLRAEMYKIPQVTNSCLRECFFFWAFFCFQMRLRISLRGRVCLSVHYAFSSCA